MGFHLPEMHLEALQQIKPLFILIILPGLCVFGWCQQGIPAGWRPQIATHPGTGGAGSRCSTRPPAGTRCWARPLPAAGSPGGTGTRPWCPPCTPCQTPPRSSGLWGLHRRELGRKKTHPKIKNPNRGSCWFYPAPKSRILNFPVPHTLGSARLS